MNYKCNIQSILQCPKQKIKVNFVILYLHFMRSVILNYRYNRKYFALGQRHCIPIVKPGISLYRRSLNRCPRDFAPPPNDLAPPGPNPWGSRPPSRGHIPRDLALPARSPLGSRPPPPFPSQRHISENILVFRPSYH